MKQTLVVVLLANLFLCVVVQAAEFNRIQTDKSKVGFVFRQMGVAMDGRINKFSAKFNFDPAKPLEAKAAFTIELASIDAGSEEANGELVKKDWFDTVNFPIAKFESTAIKNLSDNRFEVIGKVTIKGKTKDCSGTFIFNQHNKTAVFDGTLKLNRADFLIGEGTWSDDSIVANEVLIQFHLLAETVT
jgi:polyisoprenoid-binding protein YceI